MPKRRRLVLTGVFLVVIVSSLLSSLIVAGATVKGVEHHSGEAATAAMRRIETMGTVSFADDRARHDAHDNIWQATRETGRRFADLAGYVSLPWSAALSVIGLIVVWWPVKSRGPIMRPATSGTPGI
jgi:hypothetical protein